tara:strand:- start:427 stop:624 length:198 start_codon:yes stop_codon:yes gene_type:complete
MVNAVVSTTLNTYDIYVRNDILLPITGKSYLPFDNIETRWYETTLNDGTAANSMNTGWRGKEVGQ